jgi:3-deoxy-D-manno-octulosonate 8-phosphate phosphatase (KDO 8-P phosphatase)
MKYKLEKIRLIITDFDGVLTDNRVLMSQDGMEFVYVNRSDGLAVNLLKKNNIEVIILSTETNPVVTKRGEKMGVDVFQGCSDKKHVIGDISRDKCIPFDSMMYIGNDVNDLNAMGCVGIKVAPSDACKEVLEIADIVTKSRGGEGVLREVYSVISSGVCK